MQYIETFRNYLQSCLNQEQISDLVIDIDPSTPETNNFTIIINHAIEWLKCRKNFKPYLIYSVWFAIRLLNENKFTEPVIGEVEKIMSENPTEFAKCFDDDFVIDVDNIIQQYVRICYVACKLNDGCESIVNYTPIDIPYKL